MPSPSTPVVELIAANLLTTVAAITAGATYHNTVARAVRREQFATYSGDNVVIVAQGDCERNEDAPKNNFAAWFQTFWIDWLVVEPEGGAAVDTRINKARADVERAVMADHTRGTYAIDTIPAGAVILPDETGGAVAGVSVKIVVHYRTLLTDPNTQA